MDQVTTSVLGEVIAGLFVWGLTTYFAFLLSKRYFHVPLLTGSHKAPPKQTYEKLNGDWYEYHITQDNLVDVDLPFWLEDKWNLKIRRGYQVSGFLIVIHPNETINYNLVGEIRSGKMLVTGTSTDVTSEFFTAMFPNLLQLLRMQIIVGVMTAFDWNNNLYCGPIILSKEKMTIDKLNAIIDANSDLLTSLIGETNTNQEFHRLKAS